MTSKSVARRERAILVCPSKFRHLTMYDAGVNARKVRNRNNAAPGSYRICPYFCPSNSDTDPHYHIGHNHVGGEKIIDIIFRLRLGLVVHNDELDFVGLDECGANTIRTKGD